MGSPLGAMRMWTRQMLTNHRGQQSEAERHIAVEEKQNAGTTWKKATA